MKILSRIAGINLIILTVYTIIIHLSFTIGDSRNQASLGILIISVFPIAIQVFANIIISIIYFIKKDKPKGKAFLLSALIVLIIGFSSCWGSAIVSDKNFSLMG